MCRLPGRESRGRGRGKVLCPHSFKRDEVGLSTLEWILLVAAVGGLATMGVFLVRNATDATSEQVDGETDQALTASQAEAEADVKKIWIEHNLDPNSFQTITGYCNPIKGIMQSRYFNSAGDYLGQNRPGTTMTLFDKWGDIFYFSPGWIDRNGDGRHQKNHESYCAARPLISS